ncbi:MAG TPA: 30S ribosomal protein S4 [Candidatus Omnitrophota bacterium]|nr:30S ribosomal protein S4 [Candidatus Omnitrophota bacterium]HPS36164.1 30S ribosomal protein S4 [Candidatus Omnitrophota bacterium]
MGRYRGPVIRLHRREGVNLGLKGRRTTDEKHDKRLSKPPGQHGLARVKLSDYGVQLREKQKMKRIYGVTEKQFRVFFQRAVRTKGVTGEMLIQLLERRLDNVVYRLLFTASRREARQMVGHGHITVDGKKVNIPSYILKIGQKIGVKQKEATIKRGQASMEKWKDLTVPEWLKLDREKLTGEVLRFPTKAEAGLPVEESLIVELYSK